MKKFILNFIGIFLIIFPGISQAEVKKVLLVGDYWCPYNCYPNSDYEGILVDIARIAFKKKNIEVDYKIAPWIKTVNDFNNNRIDGIIGASKGDVQNAIYSDVPLMQSRVSAYTVQKASWVYDKPESLGSRKLGIIEGYTYPSELKNYIYSRYIEYPDSFYISTSDNAVEDNGRKLLQNETLVYIEDENVMNEFVASKKISTINYAGSVQDPVGLYIAFPEAKRFSKEYADLIADTYKEIEKNGKLKELYKKYKLKK